MDRLHDPDGNSVDKSVDRVNNDLLASMFAQTPIGFAIQSAESNGWRFMPQCPAVCGASSSQIDDRENRCDEIIPNNGAACLAVASNHGPAAPGMSSFRGPI